MDGTLVASDGVWDQAMREFASASGGVLPPEFFVQSVGLATAEALAIAHRTLGLPETDLDLHERWISARVHALMGDQPPRWFPGARRLIAAVRADGLGAGLVTSSERAHVEAALSPADRERFDVIVCGDDVSAPKPDPEPYRVAAAALGVEPGECAVVEDSRAGVASALAAGCRVVAVASHQPSPFTANGHRCPVVPAIGEITLRLLHSLPAGSLNHGGTPAVER